MRGTATPSRAFTVGVPLLDCDGVPCVEAQLGARPIRLLVKQAPVRDEGFQGKSLTGSGASLSPHARRPRA